MNRLSLLAAALAVPAVVAPAAAQADWHTDRIADVRAAYNQQEAALRYDFQRDWDHLHADLRDAVRHHDHPCAHRLRGEIAARQQRYNQDRRNLSQWFNAEVAQIERARHHHHHPSAPVGFQLQLGGATIGTTPPIQAPPVYATPGYPAPAYVGPSYPAPNYGAPNYGAPNYGAPNYGAPNYPAPAPQPSPDLYGRPTPTGQIPGGPGFFRPDYGPQVR